MLRLRRLVSFPLPELKYLLKRSVSQETSSTPHLWTPENPFYGHCAVFTLIVRGIYGGKIRRGLLPKEWVERLGYRSHYWNETESGVLDLSKAQFPEDFPYDDFVAGRVGDSSDDSDKYEYIISNVDTVKRYIAVWGKCNELYNQNSIFSDEKHQRCWDLAFSEDSVCAKMRFACLVYEGDKMIASDVNRQMTVQFGQERFCSFGGERCMRHERRTRTESTIGDCGHAPLWCLSRVWQLGFPKSYLKKLNFYEAGFLPDGSPWERKDPTYTCLYCQNIFSIFGLDKIWGVYNGVWTPFHTKDSFYSSAPYVLGERK